MFPWYWKKGPQAYCIPKPWLCAFSLPSWASSWFSCYSPREFALDSFPFWAFSCFPTPLAAKPPKATQVSSFYKLPADSSFTSCALLFLLFLPSVQLPLLTFEHLLDYMQGFLSVVFLVVMIGLSHLHILKPFLF